MSSTKQIDGAAAGGPEGDAHVLAALLGAEREAQRLECEARGLKDCLAARIEEGGKLLFVNTSQFQVITRGNPTSGVEVLVQAVSR